MQLSFRFFVHMVMITSDAPLFFISSPSTQRWCWDTEAHIQKVTEYFISSGLAKLGYVRINIDEGWLKGRDNATGTCDTSNASHTSPLFFPPTRPPHRIKNCMMLTCVLLHSF
jgi:hypothetical protein